MSVIQVRVHLTLCVYLRLLQQYTAGSCISNQTLLSSDTVISDGNACRSTCMHTYIHIYTHR